MKKLLAILFAAVLCIALGVTAWAEEANYTLVLSGGKGYQTEVNTGIQVDLSRLNITYNSDKQTYTFNNVNFITSAATAITILDSNAKIVIEGTNTVTGGTGNTGGTYGIECTGSDGLTISGNGSLNATAGESTNCNSFGIYVSNGAFTIQSGTVIANGSAGANSYGIYTNYTFTVNNGTVTATAGKATGADDDNGYSCGIRGNSIQLNGGTITSNGYVGNNVTAKQSYGIYSLAAIRIKSAKVTATGGTANYSRGIYSKDSNITIDPNSSAEVTAIGGAATGENSVSEGMAAFYALEVKKSNVTAIGGSAKTSRGINVGTNIKIENGTVTATANGTTTSNSMQADNITVSPAGWIYKTTENGAEQTSTGETDIKTIGQESSYLQINAAPPTTVDVNVFINWFDNPQGGDGRPDNLTVTLLADGKETDKTLILRGDEGSNYWQGTFNDLPITNDAGNTIEYSVSVSSVDGYADPSISIDTSNSAVVSVTVNISKRYTVTYNANGETGGTVPVDNARYIYGNELTILGPGNLDKDGYNFAGWNTEANGTGTAYAEGATFTISADTVLYAQWTLETYTVTYKANGGTGDDYTGTATYGKSYTILGCNFEAPTGKEFVGWNTQSNGQGTAYAKGATFTISANTTLYAIWEDIPTEPEEPKPTTRPDPCDHDLDANGKCKDCGVVIISYPRNEAETNPNTGAETAAAAIVGCAVLAAAGAVCLGKKR